MANKHMEIVTDNYDLFVDLDGVMADFAHGIRRIHRLLRGGEINHIESQYDADPGYRKLMWNLVTEYQTVHRGEFWYDLDLMEDAMILWNYIAHRTPQILTATGDPKYFSGNQKHRWVAEKLGEDIVVNLTRKAREKAEHAAPNRILIDDKLKAIDPWKEAGGIGILHTSADSTISQLKELGL